MTPSHSNFRNKFNITVKSLSTSAKLAAVAFFAASVALAQSTPAELLARADNLAESFDLAQAAPFYQQAEIGFHRAGDSRNELAAKLGTIRYRVQLGNYTASRKQIEEILATFSNRQRSASKDQGVTNPGYHRHEPRHCGGFERLDKSARRCHKNRRREMDEPSQWLFRHRLGCQR